MTPLAAELLRILQAESAYPPLSSESLSRVLWATGYGKTEQPIPVVAIEAALVELMRAGQVEGVHSSRLGARYRLMRRAAVVAEAPIRT